MKSDNVLPPHVSIPALMGRGKMMDVSDGGGWKRIEGRRRNRATISLDMQKTAK